MDFRSLTSLRDEIRAKGREIEQAICATPPPDYAAVMLSVGRRQGLSEAEALIQRMISTIDDD